MNTRDKINRILQEIETKQGSNKDIKLTTQQVMDKLLDKKTTQSELHATSSSHSNYHFDMEELSLWKESNNSFYRINYYNSIICLKRFVGKPLVFVNKVFRKIFKFIGEPIVDQQNKFNSSVTASINALYNNEIVTQSFITDSDLKMDQAANKVAILEDNISMLKNQLEEYVNQTEIKTEELSLLHEKLNESINRANFLESNINNISKQLEENNRNINNMKSIFETSSDYMNFKIHQFSSKKLIENSLSVELLEKPSNEDLHCEDQYECIDYFDFENHFRGTRQNIKDSQQEYIEYFKGKSNVIDLGCGRGEFLELLKENSIQATGVDLYREFVDYCIFKGLSAVKADAIKYLSQLDDDNVGGIFASQLVEHLHTDQILSLCKLAYRKLKDDAYLIIETPNPTCLSIYTNGFYVDPSHVKPVHPLTLEYFLKKAGFKNIEVVYTEQSKVNYKLPLLDGEGIKNLSEFNDGINLLSNIIFGSQDYAIIARK